jgi:large subunit ribosomal protein L4
MSILTKIYNQQAEKTGEIELNSKIFGKKVSESLVHQAVVAQMANQRQVLAHTKTKGEVRGGGKKPWKQKGTGRARVGSSRSPLWRGGGITFGPRNDRNFSLKINQKMKQSALFMALSDKLADNKMIILDKVEMKEYKTKTVNEMVKNFENKVIVNLPVENKAITKKIKSREIKSKVVNEEIKNFENKEVAVTRKTKNKQVRSILLIDSEKNEQNKSSFRNLSGVELLNLDSINVVDILKYRNLIITLSAVKKLEERYKK